MKISLAAGAAAAILSLSSRGPIAFAQAPAPTLSSVKAGTYKVESYHTQVGFITGNLTLHGVTKPVVLHARLVGAGVNPLEKGYTVGFEAAGTISAAISE
jgi:polyisoprenoid-binding protein YceI